MKGKEARVQTTPVDWNEIHRRLELAQAALEKGWVPAPEEQKKILKVRTKALAREPEEKPTADKSIEVVEFLLAYETYAIESSYVREVHPLKEFTPLPSTPSFVLGIINVRGQILSVIDIRKFFDLPEKGLGDLNKVIIMKMDEMEVGILADLILGVRSIPLQEIQPSLPTLTGVREEYLKGIARERVVVLDAKKLLADHKIVVHEGVEKP